MKLILCWKMGKLDPKVTGDGVAQVQKLQELCRPLSRED